MHVRDGKGWVIEWDDVHACMSCVQGRKGDGENKIPLFKLVLDVFYGLVISVKEVFWSLS